MSQECEGVSRKWGMNMSFSAKSGACMSGDRQDVGQECEEVS